MAIYSSHLICCADLFRGRSISRVLHQDLCGSMSWYGHAARYSHTLFSGDWECIWDALYSVVTIPQKKKSYLVLILVVWDIRVNHIKYMASCSTSIGNGYDFRAAFRWYVFNNDSKKVSNRCMFKANMLGSSFLCNEIDKLLLYFQN